MDSNYLQSPSIYFSYFNFASVITNYFSFSICLSFQFVLVFLLQFFNLLQCSICFSVQFASVFNLLQFFSSVISICFSYFNLLNLFIIQDCLYLISYLFTAIFCADTSCKYLCHNVFFQGYPVSSGFHILS